MMKNMGYILVYEEKEALAFFDKAGEVARNATCDRSRCGSVVVAGGEVIGRGFNSPPNEDESQRRCHLKKDSYDQKVTDKTCCVHAEQRAIIDALKNNSHKIAGSRLYFIRLDDDGNPKRSGEPYCTICSKMALDAGITEFALWHERGICVYTTEEYNERSFQYGDEKL